MLYIDVYAYWYQISSLLQLFREWQTVARINISLSLTALRYCRNCLARGSIRVHDIRRLLVESPQKARSILPRLPRRSGWSSPPLPCRKTVRHRRRRECSRSADRPEPAVSPGRSSPCNVPAERPWRPYADPKCPVSGLRTPGCSPSDSSPAPSSRTCSASALQTRRDAKKRGEKKRCNWMKLERVVIGECAN